jgi:hypothetical protein
MDLDTARIRENERRARTGLSDPWWDAPHCVREWLKTEDLAVSLAGSPADDLIAYMQADPDVPHHFPSQKYLRNYVQNRQKQTCADLDMAAMPGVYARYYKWGKHRSPPLFNASRRWG